MKTKTLILSLVLAALVVVVPTTYVLAHRATSSSYYGVTGSKVEDEDWWTEMREHMEQRWTELEDGTYRYGSSSSYGGYGGCGGMRW